MTPSRWCSTSWQTIQTLLINWINYVLQVNRGEESLSIKKIQLVQFSNCHPISYYKNYKRDTHSYRRGEEESNNRFLRDVGINIQYSCLYTSQICSESSRIDFLILFFFFFYFCVCVCVICKFFFFFSFLKIHFPVAYREDLRSFPLFFFLFRGGTRGVELLAQGIRPCDSTQGVWPRCETLGISGMILYT